MNVSMYADITIVVAYSFNTCFASRFAINNLVEWVNLMENWDTSLGVCHL